MEKDIESYFKKFYNMKPYLFIDKKEWKHIMDTYEKDDVIEELSKALHTYPCPVPEISEKDTLKSLNKLKGIKWPDLLIEGKWFPRNERETKYELTPKYFKRDNKGNNASNPFHIENRWKVDWTRMPSGWKTWQTVKGIKTIVRAYYTLEKVLLKVDLQTLRMATTLRKYVASQFKPSIAKAFYDYFESENILDFSAGWGDRLVSAIAYGCDYTGVDPSECMESKYKKMISTLAPKGERQNYKLTITASTPKISDEIVAEFELTLSIKDYTNT